MTEPSQAQVSDDLVRVFRAESGRVLSALLVYTRDIDLAEDALQDAMVQALQQWPARGLPNNLGAWLFTAAKRRLVARINQRGRVQNNSIPSHPQGIT